MAETHGPLDLHDREGLLTGEMVISSSLRNRRRRRMTFPPAISLVITGDLNPNITGNYVWKGYHNKRSYFKHQTENWFIWYDPIMEPMEYWWCISNALGATAGPWWLRWSAADILPIGDYGEVAPARGTATVAKP